jgi:hypothetical protein
VRLVVSICDERFVMAFDRSLHSWRQSGRIDHIVAPSGKAPENLHWRRSQRVLLSHVIKYSGLTPKFPFAVQAVRLFIEGEKQAIIAQRQSIVVSFNVNT